MQSLSVLALHEMGASKMLARMIIREMVDQELTARMQCYVNEGRADAIRALYTEWMDRHKGCALVNDDREALRNARRDMEIAMIDVTLEG